MENFYYGLRISIHNILSSVSEETANGIIRALQNAGFKSLSHLQLVQDEHLMYILKPIPRRKLIKAWRKPGMIEDLYERMKNGDASWQIEEFLAQARNSSESSTNPVLTESITDLLKTNICRILNPVSEETLNNIILAVQYVGLELLLDVQFVQEEDLMHVLDPIQRRQLVKAWSQQGILSLFSSANTVVHEPLTVNPNTHEESSAVKRWKPSTANSSVSDLSMCAQKESSEGSSQMDASQALPNHFSPSVDQTCGHSSLGPPVTTSPELSSSASLPFKWNWKMRVALLRLYTIYKRELSSSNINERSMWKKIAEEVGKKSPHSPDAKQCRNQIQDIKSVYERKKHSKPTDQFSTTVLDEAENAFENTENSYVFSMQSNLETADMSKSDRVKLLRVYTKYKEELSLQNFDVKQQIIWGKVAREVSKICSSFYGKRRCCYEINNLKVHYELYKKNKSETCSKPYFFEEARKAFESTQCTGILPHSSSGTTAVHEPLTVNHNTHAESSAVKRWKPSTANSSVSDLSMCAQRHSSEGSNQMDALQVLPNHFSPSVDQTYGHSFPGPPVISPVTASSSSSVNCSWTVKEIIEVLRRYAKYKSEFSHPGVKEQTVWKKIALKHDASDCRKKIDELRCKYKRIKNEDVTNRETALFLDEAKKAFETTETTEQTKPKFWLGAKKSNRDFLCKLLQVYAKYKTELACPNNEEQKVWEKIAKEMREKFSYACGETLCRFELLQLKCRYESKKVDTKNEKLFSLSHEAKEAFETSKNPATDAHPVPGGVFSPPPGAFYLMRLLPPPSSFQGPFVGVDDLIRVIKMWKPPENGTTSAELSSSVSLPFKWNWKRRVQLLRLYTIYKKELSSSNINEQSIWKKIAEEVRGKNPNCLDAKQCRNQLHNIKSEYEIKKDCKPIDKFSATVLDEAENAFADTKSPCKRPKVVLSVQNLQKWIMSEPDQIQLLKVYTKYKAELSLQNFDVEQQIIWGEVSREVSKICSSFYGKRRCYYEIITLKCQFELFKENKSETCSKPYFFEEARKAFESTQCKTTILVELPSNASLPSFEWRWKIVLLRAYTIYKRELSSSIIDKDSIWKKIATEVIKYGHKCTPKKCQSQIHNMKCDYEGMKYNKPYESEQFQTIFLDDAENAFEAIENPVVFSVQSNLQTWIMSKPDHIQLLKVYAKYKAELPLQKFDVEQQIVWGKVAREVSNKDCYCYGKRRCCYEIHNLKRLYEICKKKKLKIWEKQPYFFDEARKTFESIEHTGQHAEVNSFTDFSVKQAKRDCNASTTTPDLSMLAQRKTPAESSHVDQDPLSTGPPTEISSLASVSGKSILPDQSHNLIFKSSTWKPVNCYALLKVYARYRTELSGSNVEENHKVWKKIADEFHEQSNCLRCIKGKGSIRCTFVSGLECMEQIEKLRLRYHTHKNENKLNKRMSKFFDTARNIFETTKDSVTAFAESSLPVFKWNWKRRLILLRTYTIYKTELSSSNIKEQDVWQKISDKVKKKYPVKCDAKECYSQIHKMKCEYEEIKHKKPYESTDLQAAFLDEAENAFEKIENPVVFSVQSNLGKWAMSESDHIQLLQVYSKYKEVLLLQNFDVEQQIVWGKVAREVSKKCSSFYGKRLCCYEIHHLKRLYENFKKMKESNQMNKSKTPYYFEEARKTFESTKCTGQHGEVSSLENLTVNQESDIEDGEIRELCKTRDRDRERRRIKKRLVYRY